MIKYIREIWSCYEAPIQATPDTKQVLMLTKERSFCGAIKSRFGLPVSTVTISARASELSSIFN
jgi:hypothetical protein